MIAKNPFSTEEVFRTFTQKLALKNVARTQSVAWKANIGERKCGELGNSSVGDVTAIRQMGRQNMVYQLSYC